MKTIILTIVFILSLNFVNAQYKSYKDDYNHKTYSYEKPDKYNPSTAGALALIPGAGHCYSGEFGRGLGFVGGMAGSLGVVAVGFATLPWDESDRSEVPGYVIGAIGWAGFAAFYVWSITDAVKVAKIKNMHLNNPKITFDIRPYFKQELQKNVISKSIGFTVTMNF